MSIETATGETWVDWVPHGWLAPTDEQLITRDELLKRAHEFGVEIHPRTLQQLENHGYMPRPVRRWHNGAVRALYAPWVVDLAIRAYTRRRGKWSPEAIQADVRDAVKSAMTLNDMDTWEGRGIPMEFIRQLNELADRQATKSGEPIASVEVRFVGVNGRTVATIRQTAESLQNRPAFDRKPAP